MKAIILFFVCVFLSHDLFAQKELTALAVNLNTSRSNHSRMIYPSQMITPENANLLLSEFDQLNADTERQKQWLAANFNRFGIDSISVKQIVIYSGKQYADCSVCKQTCKGRCVQDPGAACICMYRSEPNLRMMQAERPLSIIFLSSAILEESILIDTIEAALKRATSVKSGKSNSSD